MIFIIMVQSENSLGKIIYTLHEEKEKKKFVCKEKMIAAVFFLFSLFTIFVRLGDMIYESKIRGYKDEFVWFHIVKDLNEISLLSMMTIVFITLVWFLNKYFKEELK